MIWGVPVQRLVSCAGRLFGITNGASFNGPFQLISIDPITLQPGDVFTADSLICDAVASIPPCISRVEMVWSYYLDPATLQTMIKVGTNQKEINAIAVTPKALVASSAKVNQFQPRNRSWNRKRPYCDALPLLLPIGQSTIVTVEQVPDSSHPMGLQVFCLKPRSPLSTPQTSKRFQGSIDDAILFKEGLVMAGNHLSCFSNDIDFKRLGDILGFGIHLQACKTLRKPILSINCNLNSSMAKKCASRSRSKTIYSVEYIHKNDLGLSIQAAPSDQSLGLFLTNSFSRA